jgi:hypothetical protein
MYATMDLTRTLLLAILFVQLIEAHENFEMYQLGMMHDLDLYLPPGFELDSPHSRLSFQVACDACKKVLDLAKSKLFV